MNKYYVVTEEGDGIFIPNVIEAETKWQARKRYLQDQYADKLIVTVLQANDDDEYTVKLKEYMDYEKTFSNRYIARIVERSIEEYHEVWKKLAEI